MSIGPELTIGGKIVLERLSSSELEAWLIAARQAEATPTDDVNLWLLSAGAKALGPYDVAEVGVIISGTLWRLWNGQNFWTSADGKYFSATLKEN